LPRTRTFVGLDNDVPLPSNILTLLKRVVAGSVCCADVGLIGIDNEKASAADAKSRTNRKAITSPYIAEWKRVHANWSINSSKPTAPVADEGRNEDGRRYAKRHSKYLHLDAEHV
jgi:hypothetical protein